MTTDENAQRIVDDYPHLIQPDEHAYKMAKLWLMRDEIIAGIDSLDWDLVYDDAEALMEKIKQC